MRIEHWRDYGFKITLEAGDELIISQEDKHQIEVTWGDDGASGPKSRAETQVVVVKEMIT